MTTDDYKRSLDELLRTKRDETPEQATREALKAQIRLLNLLAAGRPPEEYQRIMECVLSGAYQVRFVSYLPPTGTVMEAELLDLKTGAVHSPLLTIDGGSRTSETAH